MTILIVDDDPNMRILFEQYLNSFTDEETHTYKNGGAFLNYVSDLDEETKRSINLVLMDLRLPEMDGIKATKKLKGDPIFENLPVLAVTALNDPEKLPEAFEVGCTDFIKKPLTKMEFQPRVQSALRLKETLNREGYMANRDGLTELYNRRYFNEHIKKEFNRSQRNQTSLSFILCDIDYFKLYNDTYGHTAGDEVLKKVASSIQRSVRRPADFVARYGGEEFAVVLPDTDKNGAESRAESIRRDIEDLAIEHKNSEVEDVITVSNGFATSFNDSYDDFEKLIQAADEALYQAKDHGRNRSVSAP